MRRIWLENIRRYALVDDRDYKRISGVKWRGQRSGHTVYAIRTTWINGRKSHELMHRAILGLDTTPPFVDHWNRKGLDNRRRNLRVCAKRQNHQNQKRRGDSKTGFKGVAKYPRRTDLYRARICVNGKRLHLGCFKTAQAAARAYVRAARKHFGAFARGNW